MLRITVEDNADPIALRAEGKLCGPWVTELEKCWRSTADGATGKRICVDLEAVTFVDQNGKTLLSEMIERGVQLRATGPMMTSLVEQLVSDSTKKREEHWHGAEYAKP